MTQDDVERVARAIYAAMPAPRVKRLKWREEKGEWLADVYILQSIPCHEDEWIVIAEDVDTGRFIDTPLTCTLLDAQNIAQADYESRILAALED